MALTALNTTINEARAIASNLRADQSAKIAAIRADRTLSDTGKQQQIAQVHLKTRGAIEAQSKRETEAVAKALGDLERRVFGLMPSTPQDVVYYRDAQERVSRFTSDDRTRAGELLHLAHLSGDDILGAAIVRRALAFGWDEIVNAHTEQHPAVATDLKDLSDLQHWQSDTNNEIQRQFDYGDDRPRELGRYADTAIADIAEGNQRDSALSLPTR